MRAAFSDLSVSVPALFSHFVTSVWTERVRRDVLVVTSHMTSHIIFVKRHAGRGESMGSWQVQDAKARFSEFLDATIKKGPQIVTRRGVETAVLVPIEEWNRLQRAARPSLKASLLAPHARFENLIPSRHKLRRRAVPEFK